MWLTTQNDFKRFHEMSLHAMCVLFLRKRKQTHTLCVSKCPCMDWNKKTHKLWSFVSKCPCMDCSFPYLEPVVFQWQSSGNPVCLELRPQCTLECHWRNASVLPVVFQWSSSGFPVVFQCVPIMQINTGSPLGHHWVQASASVVPVASQCTCGSSGLPVCSNYAN